MTLKQKELLMYAVGLAGILAMYLLESTVINMLLGFGLVIAAIIMYATWMRCPNCGKLLPGSKEVYCPRCHTRIYWNKKQEK